MRIIALGDTHGRSNWKQIINYEKFDKIVFIGDYFDTYDNISFEQQMDNFKEIISYKKDNLDKVILLFGNHDYHYLKTVNETYSGYQFYRKKDIQDILHSAIDDDLLQMCFIWDNMIFSHAGITQTWCDNNTIRRECIEKSINELFKYNPKAFKFTSGKNFSQYGDDIEQSPIWVRPNSLLINKIEGYIQIVGHTTQNKLIITDDVILIDTLGTSKEYFIWDDSQFSVGIV